MEQELERKLYAKRLNEHVKLLATTLNAVGLVVFGAGVLQPLVTQSSNFSVNWSWVVISAILHLLAQALIRLIRLE
jgi:hypothetical protein